MPTILGSRTRPWPDEATCARDAAALAARPALADARVELLGPLGAGKTTFVRHLPYTAAAGFPIAHCDFYRFDDPAEWEDAGFREVFAEPGLALVEWPEKAEGLLPPADLSIAIEPDPADADLRVATVVAHTPRGVQLLW